jgi:DNA-binding transcriptional MerR regulator
MSTELLDIPSVGAVKSAAAFKTISEVSTETGLPQHVLRFWEAKFPQLRPLKRGGGRRYYRPEDVVLLNRIRRLLHEEGYTIKGVQKVLREQSPAERVLDMPKPSANMFTRTRHAISNPGARSVVLDVELLERPQGRVQLLRDLIDGLKQLRDSLDDI